MIAIELQFELVGQHNAVVFPASGIQDVPDPQQKSDGNPAWEHCEKPVAAHARANISGVVEVAIVVAVHIAAKSSTLDIRLMVAKIVMTCSSSCCCAISSFITSMEFSKGYLIFEEPYRNREIQKND